MKILFLNPHIDAEHELIRGLKQKGVSVLFSPNPQEAWQMLQLHGSSVDLAIVRRESSQGPGEPGLEFVSRFKQSTDHSDLPFILVTSEWSDADCAAHQSTSTGANGYLHWPFELSPLLEMIEAVTGQKIGPEPTLTRIPRPESSQAGASPPPPPPPRSASPPLVSLENDAGIHLEELTPESAPAELPSPEFTLGSPSLFEFTHPERQNPVGSKENDPLGAPLPKEPSSFVAEPEPRPEPEPASEELDSEIKRRMPYIFGGSKGQDTQEPEDPFARPIGDAVVPGGAADAPDVETLKKYLFLREQDVAALSTQLKSALHQIHSLESRLNEEKARSVELEHMVRDQEKKLSEGNQEKKRAEEFLHKTIDDLEFKVNEKADQVGLLEDKLRDSHSEVEKIKERVRTDLRKIRAREKELENRLEILKKDSEVLITARENRILDLKRKLDITEFNLDLLQERFEKEKELNAVLKERLDRAARAVRVAGGLLIDEESANSTDSQDSKDKWQKSSKPTEGKEAI